MAYPRKSLICLEDTPYYHVVARCVRRAWLWGYDDYAAKDYSHRKAWVLQRLHQLAEIFSIDLCAYAIMSNHYHLVVRVDRQRMARLTHAEVATRWSQLFSTPPLIQRWQDGRVNTAERFAAEKLIECWRLRLIDVSWYMRCLNEHLARRANAEDGCTGRFWEGRFKSQALLDESGLLTAMAYVDLNPVRAGIAAVPEESLFTSIYARLQRFGRESAVRPQNRRLIKGHLHGHASPPLLGFSESADSRQPSIPMKFLDYLELLDWTGRHRADNPGAMKLPPMLTRVRIEPEAWLQVMRPNGNRFGRAIGRLERLQSHARRLGQSWVRGLQVARKLQQA